MRLYSLDYAGWFVADELYSPGSDSGGDSARLIDELLRGMPHCLVLQNARNELQVLGRIRFAYLITSRKVVRTDCQASPNRLWPNSCARGASKGMYPCPS